MALDFAKVESTIAQTKVEVEEHVAASAELETARAALAAVQEQVAAAQIVVAEKTATAGEQRADVVNGINAAIAALQDLLQAV